MVLVYIYVALACYNTEYLTLPMSSIENIVDDAANVAVLDKTGNVKGKNNNGLQSRKESAYTELESHDLDWKTLWSEGTDAVMDVPIGGVCEILYGQ
jgi:phosphatidylinositol glycan class P protein